MSITAVPANIVRFSKLMGPLFTIGGLFWVADFVFIVVHGVLTNSLPTAPDPELPLYLRIVLRLLVLSVLLLVAGLSNLFARTRSKAKFLSYGAFLFMTIAAVLGTINTVTLSGLSGTPSFNDTFMGLSVFATSIATALLSTAALRTGTLPRRTAFLLLFVGLTTIPVLLGTPLPIGPDWATDHLAFLTSGLAFCLAGLQLSFKK